MEINLTAGRERPGWRCPVCNKVHAPWIAACDCHKNSIRITNPTITISPIVWPKPGETLTDRWEGTKVEWGRV